LQSSAQRRLLPIFTPSPMQPARVLASPAQERRRSYAIKPERYRSAAPIAAAGVQRAAFV